MFSDLDPKVKVISQKAGICDGVPSTSALVWFGLMLNVPVNSYGHVMTVSSPIHMFYLGKLD